MKSHSYLKASAVLWPNDDSYISPLTIITNDYYTVFIWAQISGGVKWVYYCYYYSSIWIKTTF